MSTNKAEYARYANRSTPANATQTDSMAQLERDAKATSRSKTTNIYVGGSATRETTERNVAAALEADPSVYAEYRDKHNAGAIVATLRAAGVKLAGS
jgi:hypothetical protein